MRSWPVFVEPGRSSQCLGRPLGSCRPLTGGHRRTPQGWRCGLDTDLLVLGRALPWLLGRRVLSTPDESPAADSLVHPLLRRRLGRVKRRLVVRGRTPTERVRSWLRPAPPAVVAHHPSAGACLRHARCGAARNGAPLRCALARGTRGGRPENARRSRPRIRSCGPHRRCAARARIGRSTPSRRFLCRGISRRPWGCQPWRAALVGVRSCYVRSDGPAGSLLRTRPGRVGRLPTTLCGPGEQLRRLALEVRVRERAGIPFGHQLPQFVEHDVLGERHRFLPPTRQYSENSTSAVKPSRDPGFERNFRPLQAAGVAVRLPLLNVIKEPLSVFIGPPAVEKTLTSNREAGGTGRRRWAAVTSGTRGSPGEGGVSRDAADLPIRVPGVRTEGDRKW